MFWNGTTDHSHGLTPMSLRASDLTGVTGPSDDTLALGIPRVIEQPDQSDSWFGRDG